MTISNDQIRQRRRYIGSSDAPAIVGVTPWWRNPVDVYYEKTLPDNVDVPADERPHTYVGNLLEHAFLKHAAKVLDQPVAAVTSTIWHPHHDFIAANLDGISEDGHIIECKYVGPRMSGDWGPGDTDEIPEYVLVQVQHQMACQQADLPALVVAGVVDASEGLEMRHYWVQPDQALQDAIINAEHRFWHKHVLALLPPDGVPRPSILRRIARVAECVELDDEAQQVYEELAMLKREYRELEGRIEECKNALISKLGTFERGRLPTGAIISYREENAGERVDIEYLKREFPELYKVARKQAKRWVLRGV
jgi:putative phage-type endonuclease